MLQIFTLYFMYRGTHGNGVEINLIKFLENNFKKINNSQINIYIHIL